METKVLLNDQVTPEIDSAIRRTLIVAFPHEADHFAKSRTLYENQPYITSVIMDGSVAAAHTALIKRTISIGKNLYKCAGIANVAVLPNYRGQKMGRHALKAILTDAAVKDFDFALLFAKEPLRKYYAKSGFWPVPQPTVKYFLKGKETTLPGSRAIMYYPLSIKDFPTGNIHLRGTRW
jgi:predicted N-acetyltransferase YhbS